MKSMYALVLAVTWGMLAVARAEVVRFQSDGNEQTICQDIGLIKSIFLEAKSSDFQTSMTVYFGDADVNQIGFGLAYGKDKLDFSSDSASFKNQKIDYRLLYMTYRRMIYRMIYVRGSIGKFEVHTDLDSRTLGFGFPLSISEGKSYLDIDKEFVSVAIGFNHFLSRNFYLGVEFLEYIQKIGGNSGTHLSVGSLSSADLQDEYQDIKTFSKAPIQIQPSLSLGLSF